MGLLSRLFGSSARPTISQARSGDPQRLNKVVDWFISNEADVRRHQSGLLHVLMLLGFAAHDRAGHPSPISAFDDVEFRGFRNQACLYVWRRLDAIRAPAGTIDQNAMRRTLQACAADLEETVLTLRAFDPDGSHLADLFRAANPLLEEFAGLPNPITFIPKFRNSFEQSVLNSSTRRNVAALFVFKCLAETCFYVLCWFYYSWYDERFVSPPLPPE